MGSLIVRWQQIMVSVTVSEVAQIVHNRLVLWMASEDTLLTIIMPYTGLKNRHRNSYSKVQDVAEHSSKQCLTQLSQTHIRRHDQGRPCIKL